MELLELYLFRALTGAGIGGEYAAVNSAVDELIPARLRGHVNLIINSTFWIGAALGSGASVLLFHIHSLPHSLTWRFASVIGATIGIVVLAMRRYVPESPRWLMIHEQEAEAQKIVANIELEVTHGHADQLEPVTKTIKLLARKSTPLKEIWDAMVDQQRRRSVLQCPIYSRRHKRVEDGARSSPTTRSVAVLLDL